MLRYRFGVIASCEVPIQSTTTPAIDSAAQALHWARRTYGERVVLALSFGGLGGLVLLDLARRIEPALPVYYLDTGLLFPETLTYIKQVEQRYGISAIAVQPELSVSEQGERYGDALWARDPDACCALRKVQPQRAFLKDYDAWITGLHQTSLASRAHVPRVSWDGGANVVKISPLANWTDAQLDAYLTDNDLPRNPLHAAGFTSIGCMPCTRRVAPGEDPRAGRWSGFAKTECGLHLVPPLEPGA